MTLSLGRSSVIIKWEVKLKGHRSTVCGARSHIHSWKPNFERNVLWWNQKCGTTYVNKSTEYSVRIG